MFLKLVLPFIPVKPFVPLNFFILSTTASTCENGAIRDCVESSSFFPIFKPIQFAPIARPFILASLMRGSEFFADSLTRSSKTFFNETPNP